MLHTAGSVFLALAVAAPAISVVGASDAEAQRMFIRPGGGWHGGWGGGGWHGGGWRSGWNGYGWRADGEDAAGEDVAGDVVVHLPLGSAADC